MAQPVPIGKVLDEIGMVVVPLASVVRASRDLLGVWDAIRTNETGGGVDVIGRKQFRKAMEDLRLTLGKVPDVGSGVGK
jgi:hypothetical protein